MRKNIAFIAALTLIFCLALTGCTQKAGGQVASSNTQADNAQENNALAGWRTPPLNITYDPVMVTDATPDTLENTVWVFRDEAHAKNGMVLFFRDGIMTVVNTDACYGTPYDYRNTQLTASYGDKAIAGEAIEGLLYLMLCENRDEPERIAVWTAIEEAMPFAKELNSGFVAPFTPADLGVVINTPTSSVVAEPAEDYSVTPESLDRTAWILEYDVGQTERAALFFKDGKVTSVSWDYIYEDSYTYKNNILITDEINIGFTGTVDGAYITEVTYYGASYPDLTRVDIPRAVQYATELRPEFVSPFDGDYPGFDFDTGDSGIMDGGNNGNGGNDGSQNTDGSYTWQVGNYTLTTHINVMDYIDGDVWRANEMAIVLGWSPIGIDGNTNTSAKEPSYYLRDNTILSYDIHKSPRRCNGLSSWIKADGNLTFSILFPIDRGDAKYSMNGGDLKWTLDAIVCFAYAAEQLPNNTTTNPFAGVFSSDSIYN